ncbi:MAG: LysM peptidoglycan-binding domain-containing protein [Bacteroidales bacterium]|nr:LysM peptidoglycan-binding domain-containing protein [Bacteroidales bacterium]
MDFLHFIRLFRRNIVILIGFPLLLAIVVYYFTRNKEKVYQSEAVIYTGITTGYSIESTTQRSTDYFSTSAQFDNMINLLKSRQTVVETSLRLLSQDLTLEQYNPQYISKDNFDKLQRFIPKRVKDLVVKDNRSGIERERAEQIASLQKEIRSLENQINKKKNIAAREISANNTNQSVSHTESGLSKSNTSNTPVNTYITHTVLPGESLASIASKYGISRGELLQLNNLSSGNISSGQQLIIQKGSVGSNTEFYTVQPGETLFSIAKKFGVNINKLREMNNLYNQTVSPGQRIIINDGISATNDNNDYYGNKQVSTDLDTDNQVNPSSTTDNIPVDQSNNSMYTYDNIFVKDPIVPPGVKKSDYEKTVNNMRRYYVSNDTNFIYGLLHYGENNHYSINAISNIQIFRINNSDLVKLTYTSDDPGICQQTLKIISTVFMKDYKSLRINETDRVVEYFQRQVDSADRKLSEAEDRLLQFNKRNNIINYYEQSKAIADQKEKLDSYYQDQQIKMSGAAATLQQLATKMTAKDSIFLKSDVVNQKKKELATISEKIIVNRLAQNYNSQVAAQLQDLMKKQQQLRDEIKLSIDQLYLYGHSTQGVSIKDLLDSWLTNTINYTEARAALKVLAQRKLDFIRTYQKMAPLGAMLTRIEREIKVAEQAYIELLRSLNLAKMKQQNLEMSTNIKVVDPPYFPISANPSRAKYMVLASGVGGFILIAFIIIMLEYFDTSTRTPSKVIEETQMQLAGAYPYLSSKHLANELSQISNRLIDMVIQNIKLNLAKQDPEPVKPYFILIFSTQNQVGKTLLSQKVINRMRAMGDKILYLNYTHDKADNQEEDFNQSYHYEIKNNFIDVKNLQELVDTRYLRKSNVPYDYIFLEIPSIIYHTYPIKLLSQVDLAFFVIKSNNSYTKADKTAIKLYRDAAGKEPMVLLNEVELYNLDDLLTDLPKTKPSFADRLRTALTYPSKYKVVIKKEK